MKSTPRQIGKIGSSFLELNSLAYRYFIAELEKIPNLHVMKALQSLKSRGYVKEQFAWRHYYWYLTNEGIQYLRDYLHLPPEIVPSTLKRQMRPDARYECHQFLQYFILYQL